MKLKQIPSNISSNEALVLQQVSENGEEDIQSLSRQLGMSRGYIISIVGSLKKKGLVIIDNSYYIPWVKISAQGRRLIKYLWPESGNIYAF